ncbi:MAG: phosphoglycerate dehydrogenase [Chloroflexi bacterium]|nr:phosphoglycerate dehydrogenase [Chloroflexota bacterium]
MAVRVLVSDSIAAEGLALLQAQADVDVKTGLKPDQLAGILGDYDALVVRSQTLVTAELIAVGRRLKVIGRAGVGVDNVDVDTATKQGIIVVNAPAANTISAAEHTIALMMALARHLPQAHGSLKVKRWDRNKFVGIEVHGKTLGVVGLGKIGLEVARRAQGLDMKIVAFDPFVTAEHAHRLGIELLPLEDVLRRGDFVTLHVPLTPSTENLIGPKQLEWMQPHARLINCARGGIVDEQALYEAVERGQLAGAAVDVFTSEPATDNVLLQSDKIIVTPHLGASTEEAQVRVSVETAEEVLAVLQGRPVRFAVNLPMTPEAAGVLWPYLTLGEKLGAFCVQMIEGQLDGVEVTYSGVLTGYDTAPLRAAILKGLLQPISDEHLSLVNADWHAQQRGLHIVERKSPQGRADNPNTVTVRAQTTQGSFEVEGTVVRQEPHFVRINQFWIDVVPAGYLLLTRHTDKPGVIGRVGTILGANDVNISFMQVGRLAPRGEALMILGIDEAISDDLRRHLLDGPDIQYIKLVKLS